MNMDILKIDDKVIDLNKLPADVQAKIRKLAVIDILKDSAKDEIKANNIDVDKYVNQWIQSKNSPRTQEAYRAAINNFISYLEGIGIHPLLIKAEHVDAYIEVLKADKSNNSVRAYMSACSSFYTMLKRYGHISNNPFHGCNLPRKQYKKAVRTDQNKNVPVMSEAEYNEIVLELMSRMKLKGKSGGIRNARRSARTLLPAIHFMSHYGLRVGALKTIKIEGGSFTYSSKANKSARRALLPETIDMIQDYNLRLFPFKDVALITIKKGFSRITGRLSEQGTIKHPYSCHDLRHYFAVNHYRGYKDIVALKDALDHSSLNVTDIYLQSLNVD